MAKGKYSRKAKQVPTNVQNQPRQEAASESREDNSVGDLVALDFQRQAAQCATGQEEAVYGLWGPVWKLLRWYDSKKGRHTFKKRVYLWLMLFLGWMGGHRYYQGRWKLGLLYTLFCWTGVPLVLCVTDFMEVVPLQKDQSGNVTL